MFPQSAIWALIILAWITALLPFFTEKAFVFVPWRQAGESTDVAVGWLVLRALAHSLAILCASFIVANYEGLFQWLALLGLVLLFALPALTVSRRVVVKSFAVRLVEWLSFFIAVIAIGMAVERHYLNPTDQPWQFYVVALCLYVVMAYPGFVVRHLYRNRYNRQLIAQTQVAEE